MRNRLGAGWNRWDRHPARDEIVMQLSGSMEFVVDWEGREQGLSLRGRGAGVVPRGARHTARVLVPSEAIFITRGEGTERRRLKRSRR